MRRSTRRLLERLADESAAHVLMESTRQAIEKMAQDFARDMLADPVFREELRAEATRAAREIAASLRVNREAREREADKR